MDQPHDVGIHGMLFFGEGTLYLSHLPMFMSMHDHQVILEVTLTTAGQDAQASYRADRRATGAGYTRSRRSRTAGAKGRTLTLQGTVHRTLKPGTRLSQTAVDDQRHPFSQVIPATIARLHRFGIGGCTWRTDHPAPTDRFAVKSINDLHR
jgi:hypothetical protein